MAKKVNSTERSISCRMTLSTDEESPHLYEVDYKINIALKIADIRRHDDAQLTDCEHTEISRVMIDVLDELSEAVEADLHEICKNN